MRRALRRPAFGLRWRRSQRLQGWKVSTDEAHAPLNPDPARLKTSGDAQMLERYDVKMSDLALVNPARTVIKA
ncbi:MAG: hypothetical protein WCP82_09705 [Alphaproteobacteria bacterium]|jgi:hypothetical protein